MAEPIDQSGPENRVTDPQALAPEAGRTAPVPPSTEAYNSPSVQRRNGLDMQSLEEAAKPWLWAANTVKLMGSGLLVGLIWFLNSTWFNPPAKISDLAAASSEQRVTNTELKASIDRLTERTDRQGQALVTIAERIGDISAKVNFMAGAASALHSANSPPASPITPLGIYQRQRPQQAEWQAFQK